MAAKPGKSKLEKEGMSIGKTGIEDPTARRKANSGRGPKVVDYKALCYKAIDKYREGIYTLIGACKLVGVTYRTIYNHCKVDEEINAAYISACNEVKEMRTKAIGDVASSRYLDVLKRKHLSQETTRIIYATVRDEDGNSKQLETGREVTKIVKEVVPHPGLILNAMKYFTGEEQSDNNANGISTQPVIIFEEANVSDNEENVTGGESEVPNEG